MSSDPPQIPFRHTGKVPNPQAEDRPLEADDLLFYIGETSMPMTAFMRRHGLFMDTDGLHFDLTQFAPSGHSRIKSSPNMNPADWTGCGRSWIFPATKTPIMMAAILTALAALDLLYGAQR